MFIVGLTGGIASGKTTVSNLFASLGAAIIDTDVISRSLLEPRQEGYNAVLRRFGRSILLDDGQIDRRQLRRLVFNDKSVKIWLESILHPLIRKESRRQINAIKNADYVVLVVPLLFESDFVSMVDRVVAVDCDKAVQISRLIERDNIDADLAEKIIAQQIPNDERIRLADDVINNNGSVVELKAQIGRLHDQYRTTGRPDLA